MNRTAGVSVVLPTFNRPGPLRVAIESVLAQTYTDWELIIADDGSDQATREYLRSLDDPRIRALWLEHSGNPSIARNAAIADARASLVAFLDSDDWWMPRKLETQLAAMARKPQCLWSYGKEILVDAHGEPVVDPGIKEWRPYEGSIAGDLLRIEALISTPTVIVARSLLELVGGFDAEQKFVGDYELWVRLALRSGVVAVSEPLVYVRIHREHYTGDRLGVHRGWCRLYRKFAGSIADSNLRALCRTSAATSELQVAQILWIRGEYRAAVAAVAHSSGEGWTHAAWWRKLLGLPVRALLRAWR
ncbi:MAG: glycosyltransferase [Pseudomonadota bacterium]